MVNKLLVVTGLLAFVLVSAAVAAQVAFSHEATCSLKEFECTIERDGDNVLVHVNTQDATDVRLSLRGDCIGEPVFSETGGEITITAQCPAAQPKVTLDVAVLYNKEDRRAAATGRAVA